MSKVLITQSESKENNQIFAFLKTLNPKMQEKFETIMWWESLKPKEPAKEETAV